MKIKGMKISLLILAITVSLSSFARDIEVHGIVYDEQKNPLIGVMVQVKGSNTGVMTDHNGNYRIIAGIKNMLVFRYIGYETQEVLVENSRLDVYLKKDTVALEEVVTIAFGPQKKSDIKAYKQYFIMPIMEHDIHSEEYGSFKDNRFHSALKQPLSTFSLDVDVASYGNIRRIINQGQMPPKDAVRIEEMINYFSYDYPQPTGSQPVKIITETAECPWNKKHQIVRIGVKAKEIPAETLPESNFVFLIDISGSMNTPNKLPLLKSSLKLLANNLRSSDKVSIVTYASTAKVALESTNGADRQKIIDAIENLNAGGFTAGGAGIEMAYNIAEKNFIEDGNNRVILCTDGDFNVGISSEDGLKSLIESKRKSGIYLTILGYGMGNYKDNKLQTLSQEGNGNHAYIDNIQEANKVLVNEFGSTLHTVAKDVKIQVEFNPAFVNAYRLIGYESRLLNDEDFNDDRKDAGDMGPGHTVTALYEIVPTGIEAPVSSIDPLKYQITKEKTERQLFTNKTELLNVKLRYKNPDESESRLLEVPVVATSKIAKATPEMSFIMSVAMFGQILRDSDYKGISNYDKVIELARKGLNDDPNGYRHEFIRLVQAASLLDK